MGNTAGSTPKIGEQIPIGQQGATGLAKADEVVLGQEVLVVRLSEGCLGTGVEHHDLVFKVKSLQIFG